MIQITLSNGKNYYTNPDLIQHIENNGLNTVITYTNEKKLIVIESPSEIVNKIVDYRRTIYKDMLKVVVEK